MKRLWFLMLILSVLQVSADVDECPLIVQEALNITSENCGQVGRDTLCYGHHTIEVNFENDANLQFDAPGDRVALSTVRELYLSAMQEPNIWGMAFMQIQANIPDALPGQYVTFLLFGEVDIVDASSMRNGLTATISSNVNVRSGPGTDYAVITGLSSETMVQVFGRNATGDWLRIAMMDRNVGWVHSNFAILDGAVDDLPVVEVDAPFYGLAQAFYFSSGIGKPNCIEAPQDGILVQTPEGVEEINLLINGVYIELGSTAYLQSQTDESMTVYVIEGQARVTANDMTVLVPAGTYAQIPMGADNTPTGIPQVKLYAEEEVISLPVDVLPQPIDMVQGLEDGAPIIVGIEECNIIGNGLRQVCPMYFVNPGGDPIVHFRATFLYAPSGTWNDSIKEPPEIVYGDDTVGAVDFGGYCTLGSSNFIGPIIYNVTLTDESGNVSEPFEARFNCVSG